MKIFPTKFTKIKFSHTINISNQNWRKTERHRKPPSSASLDQDSRYGSQDGDRPHQSRQFTWGRLRSASRSHSARWRDLARRSPAGGTATDRTRDHRSLPRDRHRRRPWSPLWWNPGGSRWRGLGPRATPSPSLPWTGGSSSPLRSPRRRPVAAATPASCWRCAVDVGACFASRHHLRQQWEAVGAPSSLRQLARTTKKTAKWRINAIETLIWGKSGERI